MSVRGREGKEEDVMIRRRFLTPKVRRGHLATGEQVLAYVERVNFFALVIVCVFGVVCAGIFGGSAQVYGVLCGGAAALILSLISLLTSRHKALTRGESIMVHGGGYVVKIAILAAIFFVLARFAHSVIDVRVAAVAVIVLLVLRLVLSTVIIARTPVALDVPQDDETV